ncbi:hybrid sensor histidine kinase/response regulator [Puteibacter caeruleilacunae]|nr:hybrid sensor histidine kinase/response regulator [Puteibacter caeruleilacunae]
MRLRGFLLIILIVGIFGSSNAEFAFRQISPDGGLTFQGIRDIVKDDYGYVWMSSQHGLFRYDSQTFKNYKHNSKDSLSIPHDNLTVLCYDQNKVLWMGTEQGLCTYDYSTDNFHQVVLKEENITNSTPYINYITEDTKGRLWMIVNHKLYYFSADRKVFQHVALPDLEELLTHIYNDQSGKLWIGTMSGSVYMMNASDLSINKVLDSSGHSVISMLINKSNLWVGYRDGGATLFTLGGKKLKHYRYPSEKWDIDKASVRDIMLDANGNLWFATFKGLFVEDKGKLVRYSPENIPGLTHASIYCLFKDLENGIWIGTWSGGVSYLHPNDNYFINYRHSNHLGSLSNNIISSFAQVDNKGLYVGTEVGGLNYLDYNTSGFSHPVLMAQDQQAYNIKALASDKYNTLWVGTLRGIFTKKQGASKFEHIFRGPADGKHLSGKNVYSICPVDTGIWIGLFGNGVNFYSFKNKKILYPEDISDTSYIDPTIRHIIEDSNGNMWIATHRGVYRYSNKNGQKEVERFYMGNADVPTNIYYYLYEAHDGNIWFGTKSNGVLIYDPKRHEFKNDSIYDRLNELDIYGITEDQYNHVWITTNNGLYYFDPKNNISRYFTQFDGIQSNLFNPQAIYRDANNTLFMGGTNGFSSIRPGELQINKRPPGVMINNILVNNKKDINYYSLPQRKGKASLNLEYYETSLRVEFSADNHLLPAKNRFQYRLLGMSDEWIDNGTNSTAIFTNLADGRYTLEVRAANNDGIWSKTPTQIAISIATPYWRSTAAYLVYLLIIGGIIYLFYRFITERQKLRKQVLIEQIERRNKEELHDMKLQFFTNISHEFRTPLTLIAGPIKKLMQSKEFGDKSQEYLDVVDRNSKRLLGLVNQILDFSKADQRKNSLEVTSILLNKFVEERYLSFKQLAKEKDINYQLLLPEEDDIYIDADADKLDKIIYNLLSNAFKNTRSNGTIILEAGYHSPEATTGKNYANQLKFGQIDTDDIIVIAVTDTGKGIASNNLLKIFNRFEQGSDNQSAHGTGIGLSMCHDFTLLHLGDITAQSSPGKGSRFKVRLPRKQAAQKILSNTHEFAPKQDASNIQLEQTKTAKHEELPMVLIVEDQTDLRNYLDDLLQPHYQTLVAGHGKQALNLLKNHQVDLIVSDVMMPEMDGLELCQHVKSDLEISHIPVILLTALSSVEQKVSGFSKGADAYIAKPFDENHLLVRVENLIKQRQLLKDSFSKKVIQDEQLNVGDLDNYFLNRLNKIINENMQSEDFTVEILASMAGISRSQLHRKLKNLTGSSATEYIRIIRLKHAAEMLVSSDYNIDEISYLTGFTSHSYFSKCFKQLYQVSPKEYKQQYGK